ncbi:8538_t:CDS:2 [Ambispora gerdemannii]|uniref:8538_t:CDS:1 n=1 Tax=Ambispora gerdemannii TaxID=144530 RepID=A0A9N8ZUJ1_9GLOM|nr:8538_t:CDS:2 [Ambispora gerdemannii]
MPHNMLSKPRTLTSTSASFSSTLTSFVFSFWCVNWMALTGQQKKTLMKTLRSVECSISARESVHTNRRFGFNIMTDAISISVNLKSRGRDELVKGTKLCSRLHKDMEETENVDQER